MQPWDFRLWPDAVLERVAGQVRVALASWRANWGIPSEVSLDSCLPADRSLAAGAGSSWSAGGAHWWHLFSPGFGQRLHPILRPSAALPGVSA